MTEPRTIYVGNASTDGAVRRGWIVGHFMSPDDLRNSQDIEIKWGIHTAGEQRSAPQQHEHRTTVLLLISGRFRINLESESWVLAEPGAYAMWGPGIGHSWQAETDSVVVTVRWPSQESPSIT